MYDFDPEVIPADMRTRRQWVCWASVAGKKVPRNPRNPQRNASTTNPATWTDFDTARVAAKGLGVGFVFTSGDPLVFVDLDWDTNPSDLQRRIINRLDSYTEVSPSGAGVHVFVQADKAQIGRAVKLDTLGVEIYLTGRYSTVTGDIAPYGPRPLVERTDALLDVLGWLKVPQGQRNTTLIRSAGRMRHRGMGKGEIAQALAQQNAEWCNPPLPDREIDDMAAYAGAADVAGFLRLPRQMLLSPEFAALSMGAKALLLDIAARFTGENNGHITAPYVAMQERGWRSSATVNRHLRELIEKGFLVVTRPGKSHTMTRFFLPWAMHPPQQHHNTTNLISTRCSDIEPNSVQFLNRSGGVDQA